jgi:outer membrane protein TolC
VENAITREDSLEQQYAATQLAEQNARTALDLSFEQYQRGLIEYTSVLDSQSRLHDAENSLIQIKSELIANRINLHVALGGDFQHSEAQ